MKLMRYLFVILSLVLSSATVSAQSLEAVLSSIQERHDAVEQREVSYWQMNGGGGNVPIIDKIDWTSTANDYPAEGSLSSLGIDTRVALLNQGVKEFELLKKNYININVGYLDGIQSDAKIKRGLGMLESYTDWSMPKLPMVTSANYQQILYALAVKVEQLRVLGWPSEQTYSLNDYSSETGEELKTGEDTFSVTPNGTLQGVCVDSTGWDIPDHLVLDGQTWQQKEVDSEGLVTWPSEYRKMNAHHLVTKFNVVVKGTNGLLDGNVYILSREAYNPATDVTLNTTTVDKDGAWRVEKKMEGEGLYTRPSESFEVKGDWIDNTLVNDTDNVKNVSIFQAKGHKAEGNNVGKSKFYLSEFDPSYQLPDTATHLIYERYNRVLVAPDFSKGLNTSSMVLAMEARAKVSVSRSDFQLSAGAMKFSLNTGFGLTGMQGMVGLRQHYDKLLIEDDWWDSFALPFVLRVPLEPTEDPPVVKASSFLPNLEFFGPKHGFEVLYECRRDSSHRKELSTAGWDSSLTKVEKGWAGFGDYLKTWDRPRLRQVIGKDMVLDINYADASKNDYNYVLKLYWLNQGSALTYTAEGYLNISGLTLNKEFKVTTPLDANGFPTDPHAMVIEEVGKGKYVYGGTVTDEGDITALTLKVTEGIKTLYEENWAKTENENVEVSLTTKHDGVTAAALKTTYPANTQPLSATPRPEKVEVNPGASAVVTHFDYPAVDTASWGTFWPSKITTTSPLEPTTSMEWDTNGLPKKSVNGKWTVDFSVTSGLLKAESKYDGTRYATHWTEGLSGAAQIKTYSAPDGSITTKADAANRIVTTTLYGPAETPAGAFPWAVKSIQNRDNTGSLITYTLATDGALTLLTKSGLFSGGSLTKGITTETKTNARGYPLSVTTHDIASNIQLSGTTFSDFASWSAPRKSTDYLTGLDDTWTYDGTSSRIASSTTGLGVATGGISYDALNRPTAYTWNGHAGSIDYNTGGLGVSSTLAIPDRAHSASSHWDTLGRPTSGNTTAGGALNWNISRTASATTLITTNSITGASHILKTRSSDGGLESASGSSLPFNGLQGDALSIENGLFKTTRKVTGLIAAFETTLADAWGRPHLVKKPSASSIATDDTAFSYSNPGDSIKRMTVDFPSGQRTITEFQPYADAGAITRNGLDMGTVTRDGTLGAGDRYTESVTTINNGKRVTTATVLDDDGAHEILMVERNPATGVVSTDVNDGDETLTSTPNYTTKSITTASSKGWMKNETMNQLWQVDYSSTSGDGIATFTFDPTYRPDGSLSSVSANEGGSISSANINAEGLLTSLTNPLLGNILGGHSFTNGAETTTINGITHTNSLDCTASSISGSDVVGQSRSVSANGSNIEKTINPTTGASTKLISNAAGAQTAKDYAGGDTLTTTWYKGGLIKTHSLLRGGNVQFSYSNDGAKDLAGISYPSVGSAGFSDGSDYLSHTFGYSLAGLVNLIGDGSGNRTMAYEKFRLSETDWTSGYLNAYKVERSHDATGRLTGITLLKNGSVIHSITPAHTGASDEVASISSDGGFSAIYQRNAARNITGITRGSVTQGWGRGTAGRTTSAGSNVINAPSFAYNTFDSRGRRKDTVTAGSTWQYTYGIAGQLVNASHPSLGSFAYNFDGIGRREDAGNPVNFANELNQFQSISHAQQKKLIISAKPTARLWVNGQEMAPFNGGWTYNLTAPGTEGGWVPWHVEGVLEGEGDPGAGPDAKAEFSGITYIPPAQESFTFDADGNRESSALWNYRWDGRNRLVEARTKNWDTAPKGYHLTFDYDSEGRRFKKNIIEYKNGKVKKETHITFVYDGWDLLYELRTNALGTIELERKHVWGNDISGSHSGAGGAGGLLLIRETRGSITTDYYPLFDGSGHLAALATSNGTLVAEYAYGPFGELIHAKGPMAAANPWRYATKYFDAETGLYYFGHRYYDPTTGQWLNREPLGEDESLNLYAYCHNDPVNKVDVLGLADVAVDANGNLTGAGRSILRMIEAGSVDAATALLYELQVSSELRSLEEELYRNPTPTDGVAYTRDDLFARTLAAASAAGNASRRELKVLHSKGGYKQFNNRDILSLVSPLLDGWVASGAYESFLPITQAGAAAGRDSIAASQLHTRRAWAPSAVGSRALFGLGEGSGALDLYTAFTGNRIYFDDLSYWHEYETGGLDRGISIATSIPVFGRFGKPVSTTVRSSLKIGTAPIRKAILLGEFMPRVRAAAAANKGVRVWPARNWDTWVSQGVEVQKNMRWLRDQIRNGADVFSLNKTPGFARGKYYREEVTELLKQCYRRRSAGAIDVPGFGEVKLYQWIK